MLPRYRARDRESGDSGKVEVKLENNAVNIMTRQLREPGRLQLVLNIAAI